MRAEIIRIGNSKGVRIPKVLLEECGLKDAVDIKAEDHTLIITPYKKPRQGWKEAFKAMAENGDDALLDPDIIEHPWDDEEWQW